MNLLKYRYEERNIFIISSLKMKINAKKIIFLSGHGGLKNQGLYVDCNVYCIPSANKKSINIIRLIIEPLKWKGWSLHLNM